MNLRDFFWPMLEASAGDAAGQETARLKADRDAIDCAVLKGNLDKLLDEARRLFDAEVERRRTAETRAVTYITAAGVLMPILATIAPTAADPKKAAVALPALTLAMFTAATAYLVAGIYWSFKALSVAPGATLGATDLLEIGKERNSESKLIKGLLTCVRLNYHATNRKVDAAKMSRAFALRAGITFALAILIKLAWVPAGAVLGLIFK